jgi:hypothetical protein
MTHEQREKRIMTLARELSTLLAQEAPRPPAARIISGDQMPQSVMAWLLEQIRRSNTEKDSTLH